MTEGRLRQLLVLLISYPGELERVVSEIMAVIDEPDTTVIKLITGYDLKQLFYQLVEALQLTKQTKFTPQRATKLRRRLQTYSSDELVRVAKAITDDDFLMGDNPQKKRYATIDYLLRNDEIIDRFLTGAGDDKDVNLKEVEF